MLYWYGIGLGFRSVLDGTLSRKVLRQFVEPVHYWRCLEYRLAWSDLQFTAADRVLDVGSPKLLSLFLADRVGCDVVATDISHYFVAPCRDFARSLRLSGSRYVTDVVDGRVLPYEDGSFSKIYALSVVEHIPGEGDSDCLRQVGRCLAPGGRAIVTVPFAPTPRDEFQRGDRFYWSTFSEETDGLIFYQRRYSEETLWSRLIRPSGLDIRRIQFLGERIGLPGTREVAHYLPPWTGPIHPLASRLLHETPKPDWRLSRRALGAAITLERR